jgi:hypothetical protein
MKILHPYSIILVLIIGFGTRTGFSDSDNESIIRPGVSLGTVIHHLGQPNARIESNDIARYYYDRGEIRLHDDIVTYVSLMSPEMAEQKKAKEAKQREQNTRRGIEVRDKILQDAEFAELTATDRKEFWEEFQSRYPDVDVEIVYEKTRIAARREAEKQQEEQRLANLEARVRAAENQARRAEQAATAKVNQNYFPRSSSRYTSSDSGFTIRYNSGHHGYNTYSVIPRPIVISTNANSRSHSHRHQNFTQVHRSPQRHPASLSRPPDREPTYIYGRGGNTRLNIGRMSW